MQKQFFIKMSFCILFYLLLANFCVVCFSQNQTEGNFTILGSRSAGMFSILDDVLAAVKCYEKGYYQGLLVDFVKEGYYYDISHGDNWWGYYFQPICLGIQKNVGQANVKTVLRGHWPQEAADPGEIESRTSREEAYALIQKYVHIKPHIQTKIKILEEEIFKHIFIISIHYRGTDKITEAPFVPYEKVVEEIIKVMQIYGNLKYKIFVATDTNDFLSYMKGMFKERVCYNPNAIRSTNGKPVHIGQIAPYKCGEDGLIDCVLLSMGNVLIRTSSNLSRWATYFNPKIPVIELSKRY